MVQVKVLVRVGTLMFEGGTYKKGDVFVVDEKRAERFSVNSVELVEAIPEKPIPKKKPVTVKVTDEKHVVDVDEELKVQVVTDTKDETPKQAEVTVEPEPDKEKTLVEED